MAQRRFDQLEEEIRREEAAFRGEPDSGPQESPPSLWERLTVGDVLLGGVAAAVILLLILMAVAGLGRRSDGPPTSE